jgi:hypothetical protein
VSNTRRMALVSVSLLFGDRDHYAVEITRKGGKSASALYRGRNGDRTVILTKQ